MRTPPNGRRGGWHIDRKTVQGIAFGLCFGCVLSLISLRHVALSSQTSALLAGGMDDDPRQVRDASADAMDEARLKATLAEKEEILKHRELEVTTLRTAKQNSDAALTKLQDDVAAHKKRHHEAEREKAEVVQQLHAVEIERRAEVKCPKVAPREEGPLWRHGMDATLPTIDPHPDAVEANPDLAALLAKVAVNGEVMIAISNINLAGPDGMLLTWLKGVEHAGVKNHLVVALDEETVTAMRARGTPVFKKRVEIPDAQKDVGTNHAVSGLKFQILKEFLELGYSVLLSDVDVVTLKNPFEHLYRDCDVESMTDGWDNNTAYGFNDIYDDEGMGWARYAHSMRVFVLNSGLFYLRATARSIALTDRVTDRLQKEKAWDQAVFNEEIFFPSHNGRESVHVSRRVMDYLDFVNSKVLFRRIRGDKALKDHHVPVVVHINYHPDKHARMQAVVRKYIDGKANAYAAIEYRV